MWLHADTDVTVVEDRRIVTQFECPRWLGVCRSSRRARMAEKRWQRPSLDCL